MSNKKTDNNGMTDTLQQTFERLENDAISASTNSTIVESESDYVITQEYFDKICDELESMNYIELTKTCRQLKTNKDELVHAKRTADQLVEFRNGLENTSSEFSTLNDAIMEANAETEAGTETIDDFLSAYDDTMNKLEALIEKAETLIHKFDDQEKTTSFLTENMLSVLNKNIERMEKRNEPSLKNIKIFYKVMHEIFSNRTSVSFLVEKVLEKKISVTRLRESILKDKTGSVLSTTQKMVGGTFSSIFNAQQLEAIESYLQKIFENDDNVFYLQYALAQFYDHEKSYGKYGKHKWVEVMFMNILDICVGTYDLDGGEDHYVEQLLKLEDAMNQILV